MSDTASAYVKILEDKSYQLKILYPMYSISQRQIVDRMLK